MTSVSQQIHDTIKMNNDAVIQLEGADYESSIATLATALRSSKHILESCDGTCDFTPTPSLDDCMSSRPCSPKRIELICEEKDDTYNQLDDQEAGPSYVYRHAIHVPLEMADSDDYETCVKLSVIILFNLALAHQMSAMVSTKLSTNKKESMLRKALKFYMLSYNLHREEELQDTTLFILAAVNNMGLLYHVLNEEESSGKCFSHLLATLMFLIDCGEGSITKNFDGFFTNASHMVFPSMSTAAAA